VKYFNGFSLRGEEVLFEEFLDPEELAVAGFSYGAQRAFEAAYHSEERIERLLLLSPAFFQTKRRSFIRLQLQAFRQERERYIQHFLSNVAYPAAVDLTLYLDPGSDEELEALLSYRWEREKIMALLERGVRIEVYLGGEDRIIESADAFAFFSDQVPTYLIREAGHLLR
jgi:pimeloyl-ACP methyl ester carboxylesterase